MHGSAHHSGPAKLTITVPEAGRLLGIGRDAAYRAAARGEIPTLRLGRRLVVPLARLERLLEDDGERATREHRRA